MDMQTAPWQVGGFDSPEVKARYIAAWDAVERRQRADRVIRALAYVGYIVVRGTIWQRLIVPSKRGER